ncbi:MAG: peptidoglycan bridge formation glycyltransferase FemA/FemB family protein [Bacilli bacterium]|nr:peptidoglycan bridge formation glycyltransferase FemA/FemB family protein [Bacilli bacterium]
MITEITANEFDRYAINHSLGNFRQSSNYATLMAKNGYERKYLAYYNKNEEIEGVTLLLIKKIKHIFKYAYAPQGFLINYKDQKLVKSFTSNIKKYAKKNHIIFIKINPEIPTYIYDKNLKKHELSNHEIINTLTNNGYLKLKDNLYFESLMPRYNGIINLKKYNDGKLNKSTRNRIHNAERKGLEIETTQQNKIKDLYPFIENKKRRRNYLYYKNYFQIFNDSLDADIFLVSLNYDKFLKNSKEAFENEQENNKLITEQLFKNNNEVNLRRKMNSDRILSDLKKDVIDATYAEKKENLYIAGAMCIKYKNHVHIIISGYNELYKKLNANYYLHHEIIKYYQDNFDYLDLNGMSGDFSEESPYRGLNTFKLGFNPTVYEFIGEFDLVVNQKLYDILIMLGFIQEEFRKKD